MRSKVLQQDLEDADSRSSLPFRSGSEERQNFHKERIDSKKVINYWGLHYEAICKAIFKREWLPPAIDNLERMEAVEKINRALTEFATEEDLIPREFSK